MVRTTIGDWLPVPEHQDDAFLNQTDPTSDLLYDVLEVENARIICIAANVTWTVQPTPLEVLVTIDGQPINFQVADPQNSMYYNAILVNWLPPALQTLQNPIDAETYRAFLLEGRNILIQARTTGGTVQTLTCRVKYALW